MKKYLMIFVFVVCSSYSVFSQSAYQSISIESRESYQARKKLQNSENTSTQTNKSFSNERLEFEAKSKNCVYDLIFIKNGESWYIDANEDISKPPLMGTYSIADFDGFYYTINFRWNNGYRDKAILWYVKGKAVLLYRGHTLYQIS